jgi:hypothetical protein
MLEAVSVKSVRSRQFTTFLLRLTSRIPPLLPSLETGIIENCVIKKILDSITYSHTSILRTAMPPRWPRKPDRRDAAYRRLDDRMNFAVHVAVFAACNSGLWFVRTIQYANWSWTYWVTGIWGLILVGHAVYIFAIADYTPLPGQDNSANSAQG